MFFEVPKLGSSFLPSKSFDCQWLSGLSMIIMFDTLALLMATETRTKKQIFGIVRFWVCGTYLSWNVFFSSSLRILGPSNNGRDWTCIMQGCFWVLKIVTELRGKRFLWHVTSLESIILVYSRWGRTTPTTKTRFPRALSKGYMNLIGKEGRQKHQTQHYKMIQKQNIWKTLHREQQNPQFQLLDI